MVDRACRAVPAPSTFAVGEYEAVSHELVERPFAGAAPKAYHLHGVVEMIS
jgi:hypothetical protein